MTDSKSGPDIIRAFVRTLPASPGVYRMLDAEGEVMYVGKARNLKARVTNYTRPENLDTRLQRMIASTRSMEFVRTETESEALLLEEARPAAGHDAAGRVVGELVHLEGHGRAQRDGEELLAGSGAEEQRLPVHRIVDRDDVHVVLQPEREPAELVALEELPALLVVQAEHAVVVRLFHADLHRTRTCVHGNAWWTAE